MSNRLIRCKVKSLCGIEKTAVCTRAKQGCQSAHWEGQLLSKQTLWFCWMLFLSLCSLEPGITMQRWFSQQASHVNMNFQKHIQAAPLISGNLEEMRFILRTKYMKLLEQENRQYEICHSPLISPLVLRKVAFCDTLQRRVLQSWRPALIRQTD